MTPTIIQNPTHPTHLNTPPLQHKTHSIRVIPRSFFKTRAPTLFPLTFFEFYSTDWLYIFKWYICCYKWIFSALLLIIIISIIVIIRHTQYQTKNSILLSLKYRTLVEAMNEVRMLPPSLDEYGTFTGHGGINIRDEAKITQRRRLLTLLLEVQDIQHQRFSSQKSFDANSKHQYCNTKDWLRHTGWCRQSNRGCPQQKTSNVVYTRHKKANYQYITIVISWMESKDWFI